MVEHRAFVDNVSGEPGRQSHPWLFSLALGKEGWILLVAWLAVVVVLSSFLPVWIHSVSLNLYVLQPLLWISVGFFSLRLGSRDQALKSRHPGGGGLGLALLVGGFQVSVFVLAGLVLGFGNSPYSHRPILMVLNGWFFLTRLAAIEIARSYLIDTLKKNRPVWGVTLVWLLLLLASLPFTRLWTTHFDSVEDSFHLVGRQILPGASENILATYLAMVGGPGLSFAYRLVPALFEWFAPILPNLQWTMTAFLGTVTPVLGLLFVRQTMDWLEARRAIGDRKRDTQPAEPQDPSYPEANSARKESQKESFGDAGWVLVSIFLVFIVWFNSGLFGVRPTLISGISMEPTIRPGDIAITREIHANEIKPGDIVLFTWDRYSILHRVVLIEAEGDERTFTTKGDNVDLQDAPWKDRQLRGKLILVIPKLGWISIGLKLLINRLF